MRPLKFDANVCTVLLLVLYTILLLSFAKAWKKYLNVLYRKTHKHYTATQIYCVNETPLYSLFLSPGELSLLVILVVLMLSSIHVLYVNESRL